MDRATARLQGSWHSPLLLTRLPNLLPVHHHLCFQLPAMPIATKESIAELQATVSMSNGSRAAKFLLGAWNLPPPARPFYCCSAGQWEKNEREMGGGHILNQHHFWLGQKFYWYIEPQSLGQMLERAGDMPMPLPVVLCWRTCQRLLTRQRKDTQACERNMCGRKGRRGKVGSLMVGRVEGGSENPLPQNLETAPVLDGTTCSLHCQYSAQIVYGTRGSLFSLHSILLS